jgi:hypothetical protein
VDPQKEFVKRHLNDAQERIDVGVVIVDGRTAGLACANRLLQLLADDAETSEKLGEVPVAVVEKAKVCGAHSLLAPSCSLPHCWSSSRSSPSEIGVMRASPSVRCSARPCICCLTWAVSGCSRQLGVR